MFLSALPFEVTNKDCRFLAELSDIKLFCFEKEQSSYSIDQHKMLARRLK
jgi:hypothetical protein